MCLNGSGDAFGGSDSTEVPLSSWAWLWQAMPTGEETDFILVSCAGALVADDEPASAAAVLSHKRKGEQALRHSGLGYTIVRPGPLLEEPGGYKALVFDQAGPAPQSRPYNGVAVCAHAAEAAAHESTATQPLLGLMRGWTIEELLLPYSTVATQMPCCASLADSSLHVVTVSCAICVALWLRRESMLTT